ncbi:ATPase with role in protein import into the ER [Blyttiomyces sp. JEL0837]|nr:ATPase with role in protein import into the ER [Blyttiomyces sp. JEL0837]
MKSFYVFLVLFAATGSVMAKRESPPPVTGEIVGIDLGATNSRLAVYQHGRVEVLSDYQGYRNTPSYVAFTDEEQLVGLAAKHQAYINPKNTIFNAKRLIGRRFDEQDVQNDMKHLPFKVVPNKEGKPVIQVKVKGENVTFAPEEITAMVLGSMMEIVETALGQKPSHAVITVPAYFNDAQRKATMDAGKVAGLTVVRLINEATAAAMAYELDKTGADRNILVYDLGGSTFHVSVLTVEEGVHEMLAINGDTHLGGEDFNNRVVDYFVNLYKAKTGKDCAGDVKAMNKLKLEVEKAKLVLSRQSSVKVRIDSFYDGDDFNEVLTRKQFEKLNIDLFEKTLEYVEKALQEAGKYLNDDKFSKRQIDDIILVGGSTHIPKVVQLLEKFFDGQKVKKYINPDVVVAYGATNLGGTWFNGTVPDIDYGITCFFDDEVESPTKALAVVPA